MYLRRSSRLTTVSALKNDQALSNLVRVDVNFGSTAAANSRHGSQPDAWASGVSFRVEQSSGSQAGRALESFLLIVFYFLHAWCSSEESLKCICRLIARNVSKNAICKPTSRSLNFCFERGACFVELRLRHWANFYNMSAFYVEYDKLGISVRGLTPTISQTVCRINSSNIVRNVPVVY